MAVDNPRCTIMLQGKAFDICCIGSRGQDGTVTLFPHETAFKVDEAFEKFAAYLKQAAAAGNPPMDALDLLRHQRTTGVNLVLVSETIIVIDGDEYEKYNSRQIKKNFSSEFIYGKLEAVLPRVKASAGPSAQATAQAPSDGPRMVTMPNARTRVEEPARRDPAFRKPMNIITQVQGNSTQDALAAKVASLEKELGVRAGHDGGGLKAPVVMSARRNGAVLIGLDQASDEEITERDSMALAGGVAAAPQTQQRIAMPDRADSSEQDPFEGIDLGEPGAAETETPANLADQAPVKWSGGAPDMAPRPTPPRPPARPVATMSGDQADRLAASTAPLSEQAQLALCYQKAESQAVDAAGDVVEEFFVGHSERGAEQGADAAFLAEGTQLLEHGGRQVQKSGVVGTGRGGTRPKTDRDKTRHKPS